MKLAVTAPCLYPHTKLIHYLMESCARQGIELMPHGIGTVFGGWANGLISTTIPFLKELRRDGYTHVLYVDGVDSIIIAPQAEILEKYEAAGSPPCIMSSDCECFPPLPDARERFLGAEPWRYLNAGNFITDIDFFVQLMTRLGQKYADDGNQQSWLVHEWPIEGMVLDDKCQLFNPMDGSNKTITSGDRVVNVFTGSWPCVLHFRGGYSDPETGRDFRIEPVWRQLYGEKDGPERGLGSAEVPVQR